LRLTLVDLHTGLKGLVKDAQTMKFMNVTVAQATTGLLVGVEVACWFYVGMLDIIIISSSYHACHVA